MCCIIGNLFDNAIDASMQLPESQRLIRVYMDMKNTQLYISFTNFTAGKKLQKVGGLFRTTKGEGHGADRRHRRAAGRLHQPQQRGRRFHHRDPAAAGLTCNSSPKNGVSSPECSGDDFLCYNTPEMR